MDGMEIKQGFALEVPHTPRPDDAATILAQLAARMFPQFAILIYTADTTATQPETGFDVAMKTNIPHAVIESDVFKHMQDMIERDRATAQGLN